MRQGLGRRLFGVLLEHVRSHNPSAHITLTTPRVNAGPLAFYRSLGFRDSRTFTVREEGWDSQLEITEMRMDLLHPDGSTMPPSG